MKSNENRPFSAMPFHGVGFHGYNKGHGMVKYGLYEDESTPANMRPAMNS